MQQVGTKGVQDLAQLHAKDNPQGIVNEIKIRP